MKRIFLIFLLFGIVLNINGIYNNSNIKYIENDIINLADERPLNEIENYEYSIFENRNELGLYVKDFENVNFYLLRFEDKQKLYSNSQLFLTGKEDSNKLKMITLIYRNGTSIDFYKKTNLKINDAFDYSSVAIEIYVSFLFEDYRNVEWLCSNMMEYEEIDEEDYGIVCMVRSSALYELGEYEKAIHYAELSKKHIKNDDCYKEHFNDSYLENVDLIISYSKINMFIK